MKTTPYHIDVSKDRLTVTVRIPAGAPATAAEVISALRTMNLHRFDDGALMEAMEQRTGGLMEVVVAAGTPPIDGRPAKPLFKVPFSEDATTVTRVEPGQVIASLNASVLGTDGVDVFGQKIPAANPPSGFQPGDGVTMVKGELTATAKGNLRLVDGRLCVIPLLEIHGDEASTISFDGDVSVKGSLRCASARVGGSLYVGGACEGVEVRTGGDLIIKGAIIGKPESRYVVGRNLRCRYISAANITVAGDIGTQGEVLRSTITCGGRLSIAHGNITGGEVAACGGIECTSVGSEHGVVTLVEAGADRAQLALAEEMNREIEANRKRSKCIREKIEPLMKHLKSLTPQQREKVTELMSEAGELEEKTEALSAGLSARCEQIRTSARPEVVVRGSLHTGVTVRFPRVEAAISTALLGPLLLAPHGTGADVSVRCTDSATGNSYAIPSRAVRTRGFGLAAAYQAKAA